MPLSAEPPLVLIEPGQDQVPFTVVALTAGELVAQLWERRDFAQWTRVPAGDVVHDADLPPRSGRITRAVGPGGLVEVVLTYDIDFDPEQVPRPDRAHGR